MTYNHAQALSPGMYMYIVIFSNIAIFSQYRIVIHFQPISHSPRASPTLVV